MTDLLSTNFVFTAFFRKKTQCSNTKRSRFENLIEYSYHFITARISVARNSRIIGGLPCLCRSLCYPENCAFLRHSGAHLVHRKHPPSLVRPNRVHLLALVRPFFRGVRPSRIRPYPARPSLVHPIRVQACPSELQVQGPVLLHRLAGQPLLQ